MHQQTLKLESVDASTDLCLLKRIAQLGSGYEAAGDRRRVVQRLEEVGRRQAEAYKMASRNRGLSRVGHAFVP